MGHPLLFEVSLRDGPRIVGFLNYLSETSDEVLRNEIGAVEGVRCLNGPEDGITMVFSLDSLGRSIANSDGQGNVSLVVLTEVLNNLVNFRIAGLYGDKYFISRSLLRSAIDCGSTSAIAMGMQYFSQNLKYLVPKISVKTGGDESIGSSVLFRDGDGQAAILTAKHNVEGIPCLRVELNGEQLPVSNVDLFKRIDACIIRVDESIDFPHVAFSTPNVLDKVVCGGYPTVSLMEESALLASTGEINGFLGAVEAGSRLAISSFIVSPGNSGGPVFNSAGALVGLVSREIIYKHMSGQSVRNAFLPCDQILYDWDNEYFERVSL